jgi:hypothetical protein
MNLSVVIKGNKSALRFTIWIIIVVVANFFNVSIKGGEYFDLSDPMDCQIQYSQDFVPSNSVSVLPPEDNVLNFLERIKP